MRPPDFRPLDFLPDDFRPPDFAPLRSRGTFFPFALASESPIAIACFRLFTFFPEPPERSVPRFRLCIARSTSFEAPLLYFLPPDFLRVAMSLSSVSEGSIEYAQGSSRLRTFSTITRWLSRDRPDDPRNVVDVRPSIRNVVRMHEQLTRIVASFVDAQARLHRLVAAIPDDRWAVRADPQRWSVAECVVHLNLTSRAYPERLRAALAEARSLGEPASRKYRRDFAGWLLSLFTGPLLRIGGFRFGRVKTIASFVPTGDAPKRDVVTEFDRLQAEQIAIVRDADGLPIDRVKIVSPFNARMKYNVYSALAILPRHQHRHLEQAERVWM